MNCELLETESIAYILSLAFQVAGAVLLIIKYCGNTKQRIIDEYFPGSNIAERDENDNAKLEKEKVQKCAQTIYDNRAAFVFIAIGYILSVFGDAQDKCKLCMLAYVIVFTMAIIVLEKRISIKISKVIYRNDIEIPYNDIKNRADTEATESEIDEMFNNTSMNDNK